MFTTQYILQQLQQIKPQLQKDFQVREIALFGSYARNEQHENSDIDLMVTLEKPSYINLCRTRYLIQSYLPGINVQVLSKKGIKPAYFESIKQDLIYA